MNKFFGFAIILAILFWWNQEPAPPPIDQKAFVENVLKSKYYWLATEVAGATSIDEKLVYKGMLNEVIEEMRSKNICITRVMHTTQFVKCEVR